MKTIITPTALRFSSILTSLLILLSFPLDAQTTEPREPIVKQREAAAERISTQVKGALERLQLNDEQREAVRPIIEANFEQRLAVLQKHGINPKNRDATKRPSIRKMLALRNDLGKVVNKTEKELRKVLSDEQMNVWKELEKERREQMRERFRRR